MNDKEIKKEWFYSQKRLDVSLCEKCEMLKVYRLGYTGQYIFEVEIESGIPGETVEIDQITDIHFNYASLADSEDKEIVKTRKCRLWNGDGESVMSAVKAMDVAEHADQTVITGDTLDYLSRGGILLFKRYITERDPNVMVTLGGHELTKQMQTGESDRTPLDFRYELLESFWPHEMFYFSKSVKDKVLAVCLDNSRGVFHPITEKRLEDDIKKARNNGRIILLFMHEPIKTNNTDGELRSIWAMSGAPKTFDFGEEAVGAAGHTDEVTDRVCKLISENADVIKGIFCGHLHSAFYTSVCATYRDENGLHSSKIPQIVTPGNPYLGHSGIVTRIIVR